MMAAQTETITGSPTLTSASKIPTCTTAVPDRFGHVSPDACNANYGFYPSWEANLAFALAFGITTLVHLVQAVVYKKGFCWVLIMGGLWECLCFTLRTLGAHDQQEFVYVVSSTLLLLLAPLWINAFAYMTVARLVYLLLPKRKVLGISARWLAKGFVLADVVSFVIQAAGGAMIADQDDRAKAETGKHIYMGGIGFQLLFVLVFVVFAMVFHKRVTSLQHTGKLQRGAFYIQFLTWTMLTVLGLIVVRIVFRFVEFSQGVSSSNPVLQHEAYQLCLDGLPMLIALVLLNVMHPGLVLKGSESSFPSSWGRCFRRPERGSGMPLN